MYFFRLAPLQEELASRGLTERDRFKYVMAWMVTIAIQMGMGNPLTGTLKTGTVLLDLVITIIGVRYAWRRNGADAGTGFLDRYFSIGWVVMLRAMIAVNLIGALVLLTPLHAIADLMDDAGGFASAFTASDDEPQESGAEAGAFVALLGLLSSLYVARVTGRRVGQVREAAEQRGSLPGSLPTPLVAAAPAAAYSYSTPPPAAGRGAAALARPAATGLDRFVESVVQRELAAGTASRSGGRRRSTIRPLRSSRRASRKPTRKSGRKHSRKSSRRR